MTNLEIVIIGIAPMVTLFVGIVGGLMFDRKKLAGLGGYVARPLSKRKESEQGTWRIPTRKWSRPTRRSLKKSKKCRANNSSSGVDAFLENCRSRSREQASGSKMKAKRAPIRCIITSLKMYQTSLDATLNTLNAEEPMKFQELLAPLRAQVVETISSSY